MNYDINQKGYETRIAARSNYVTVNRKQLHTIVRYDIEQSLKLYAKDLHKKNAIFAIKIALAFGKNYAPVVRSAMSQVAGVSWNYDDPKKPVFTKPKVKKALVSFEDQVKIMNEKLDKIDNGFKPKVIELSKQQATQAKRHVSVLTKELDADQLKLVVNNFITRDEAERENFFELMNAIDTALHIKAEAEAEAEAEAV